EPQGRSTYGVANHNVRSGWCKFPAKGLYKEKREVAFDSFRLRHRTELDALKIYFLIAALRDNTSNEAYVSYEKIEENTGGSRHHIPRALSLLSSNGLINTRNVASTRSAHGYST